ncbi:MAG: spore maturation protein [Ruminococcaceae bacterium]|nr:spore maturation protein [Oscillospiraceae bacterium]
MKIIEFISKLIVPLMFIITIITGLTKKVNIYESFTEGIKESLQTAFNIFPNIAAIMIAIGLFRASGLTDFLTGLLTPFLTSLNIPSEIIPLAVLKPMSGSGSLAILNDILKTAGADSRAGIIASVIAGSTETTFYTVAVYFGAVGIKDTRHTVACALIADLTCMITGIIVSNLLIF